MSNSESNWQRLLWTGSLHRSQTILVECEAPVKSPGPHGLVEDVAAGEVENSTVELVVRDQTDIKSPGGQMRGQSADSHELGCSLTQRVCDDLVLSESHHNPGQVVPLRWVGWLSRMSMSPEVVAPLL